MAFTGWPPEAFAFFERLAADNTRAFWHEHKDTYESAVKAPFGEFSDAVAEEFGPLHLFRPYRDVRFSKDKTPYKTSAGAVTESEGGAMYYVELRADGLFVGCGMYHLAADQLERWRSAVDDVATGGEIAALTSEARRRGYEIGAMHALKTAPRGWPRDHPRVDLLRLKGCTAGKAVPLARWMHTTAALGRLTALWHECDDLARWLETHVGPSTLPPDGRR